MKRRTVTGRERDVVSRYWRRVMCWAQRAGATSSVKRGMRRRERQEAKTEIRRDTW